MSSCLSLVSDPESSVQHKAAQCTYDLIVHPSVTWAKWCSGSSPRVDVSMDLVWHLCCKISETGENLIIGNNLPCTGLRDSCTG